MNRIGLMIVLFLGMYKMVSAAQMGSYGVVYGDTKQTGQDDVAYLVYTHPSDLPWPLSCDTSVNSGNKFYLLTNQGLVLRRSSEGVPSIFYAVTEVVTSDIMNLSPFTTDLVGDYFYRFTTNSSQIAEFSEMYPSVNDFSPDMVVVMTFETYLIGNTLHTLVFQIAALIQSTGTVKMALIINFQSHAIPPGIPSDGFCHAGMSAGKCPYMSIFTYSIIPDMKTAADILVCLFKISFSLITFINF